MRLRFLVVMGLVAITTAIVAACSSPDTTARVDASGPGADDFKLVAPMLVRRCGSIDCHGSSYRNFRLYGYGGQRLAATDRPDTPQRITDDEVRADYDAVVGLEPEIIRDVMQANGTGFDRLSIVRKGRNEEDHKGGQRMTPGDPADTCLVTWFSRVTNATVCASAGCVGDGGVLERCEP